MGFFNLQIKEKVLFSLVVILLLFLAYSEALKNLSAYLLIGFFLWSIFTGRIKITKDIINISIISHLAVVLVGIFIGININESLNQVMDVIRIVLLFLFFREANLQFLTYEKILNLLFVGFTFAFLAGMYELLSNNLGRLELHSVGSINRSAVYIMYIFVVSLCLKDEYQERFSSLLFPLILIISLISIIIGASRMAILSTPVILILYLILSKKFTLKLFSLLCVFVFTSFFLVINLLPDSLIADKLSRAFNDLPRVQIWISSIYAWTTNNLLFGIGVGNSIFIDVNEYFPNGALTGYIDNPHNVYLDMLLERGLLGLVSFVIFLFSILSIKENNQKFLVYLRTLVFSLLVLGIANITFRYEFALLFVILIGSYLNPSIKK